MKPKPVLAWGIYYKDNLVQVYALKNNADELCRMITGGKQDGLDFARVIYGKEDVKVVRVQISIYKPKKK